MPPPPPVGIPVRPVWTYNLDLELRVLRDFATNARYVAVNVNYPRVIHGAGQHHSLLTAEERYAVVKANVDALKPVQVGLAVYNDNGDVLDWEFNLREFDPATDPHAANSVGYLAERALSFDWKRTHGVAAWRLAMAFKHCGLVSRRPGLCWVTYTGAYHMAYLMKVLSRGNLLPNTLAGFLAIVRRFLGEDVYDVARMAVDCSMLPPGLARVASVLRLVPAAGSPLLAGAGSVLALQTFLRLKYEEFGGDVNRYRGVLHGIQVV